MISSQTIQTSIDELKAITKVDLCVYDLSGAPVATTTTQFEIAADLISGFAYSPADSQVIGVHHLLKIMDEGELLYILVAKGPGEDVYMVGKSMACWARGPASGRGPIGTGPCIPTPTMKC